MKTFFIALLLLSSVGVIVSTLLMDPKAEGMGSITGGGAHLFNHASRGKEKLLHYITVASGIIFAVSTIVVTILSR